MWIAFAIGIVALLATFVVIVISGQREPTDKAPKDWYGTDEAQAWDEKLRDSGGDFGLAGARATATAWGASITALLGVFAAVAVIKGPDSLTSVGGWQAQVAAWLILAAAGMAMVAVLLCALAAQGVPIWRTDLDAWSYRSGMRYRAQTATEQLKWSRYLVLGVLLLLILAMGVTWLTAVSGASASKPVHAIVVTDRDVECGVVSNANGIMILDAGHGATPIANAKQVTIIDKCP
jgi:hypothetical protein